MEGDGRQLSSPVLITALEIVLISLEIFLKYFLKVEIQLTYNMTLVQVYNITDICTYCEMMIMSC